MHFLTFKYGSLVVLKQKPKKIKKLKNKNQNKKLRFKVTLPWKVFFLKKEIFIVWSELRIYVIFKYSCWHFSHFSRNIIIKWKCDTKNRNVGYKLCWCWSRDQIHCEKWIITIDRNKKFTFVQQNNTKNKNTIYKMINCFYLYI